MNGNLSVNQNKKQPHHKSKSESKKQDAKKEPVKLPTEVYNTILERLIKKFPNAFSIANPKVFKLGIHKDIREKTDLSYLTTKLFLMTYCQSPGYKLAHFENAARYDLEGNVVGKVTLQESEHKSSK